MLSSTVLLDTPLVRVADVRCRAPAGGCGAVEHDRAADVVVPRRGVFRVHRRGGPVVADAASVVVFGAGEEYRVSHPAQGGDVSTVLRFAPALLEEAAGGGGPRHATLRPRSRLAVSVLTAALASGRADPLEAEEAALLALAALADDLGAGRPAPPPHPRVEEVRALLAARPAEPWRLEAVARAVHCSPFHLARQFRAATGETIGRYLLRLRLALALERLADGERALGRLAVELGFAHHSHFSARFRAAFGTTPDAVRTILTAPPAARP
jgi:AraC-like DNA-binding protein